MKNNKIQKPFAGMSKIFLNYFFLLVGWRNREMLSGAGALRAGGQRAE